MGMDAHARLLFGIPLAFDDVMYKAPKDLTCGRGHWYADLPGGSFCPRCGGQLEEKQPWKIKSEIGAVWPELEKDGLFGWRGLSGVHFYEAQQVIGGYREVPCPLLLGKEVLYTYSHRSEAGTREPKVFYPGIEATPTSVLDKMTAEVREVAKPLWHLRPVGFVLQTYISA